jgi:hypothetical protein
MMESFFGVKLLTATARDEGVVRVGARDVL